MKIALIHFRIYETDGVSLEMDKWKICLERMGHEVIYISGSKPRENDIYLDYLDYRADYNKKIYRNAFNRLVDFNSKIELLHFISEYADKIYEKLGELIHEHGIDLIIPNNVSSLGFNLPVGIAFKKIDQQKIVKIIYHHHDFHWERERYKSPTFPEIQDILNDCFPYAGNAKHCVINKLAKAQVKTRKNIESFVVPNVFDFDQDLWVRDNYNKDLRNQLGISKGDIVFLQATRIAERKAIEIGFRVIEEICQKLPLYMGKKLYNGATITKETKVHFVIAGQREMLDENFENLDKLMSSGCVHTQYITNIVGHNRKTVNNSKIYSLWDAYTICDFINYTSVLEGWGNQLIEGLFAKKPLLVYEYPVFKSDIKETDFSLVLVSNTLHRDKETGLYQISETETKRASKEILKILFDRDSYFETVEKNFQKAKKHYSYNVLSKILDKIIKTALDE